jgi:transposase
VVTVTALPGAKVNTQDLYGILPLAQRLSNIVGSVYWKPIYNLLEDLFAVLVVNAQHIKAVPGRKTDVRDAEWIAELLQHGLLRGSYIPERPQRERRELTR